jgi:hypothetical protein
MGVFWGGSRTLMDYLGGFFAGATFGGVPDPPLLGGPQDPFLDPFFGGVFGGVFWGCFLTPFFD